MKAEFGPAEELAEPRECDRCPRRVSKVYPMRLGNLDWRLCWACWQFYRAAYGVKS